MSNDTPEIPNGSATKLSQDGADFKYWAFISYSSKDTPAAKRLHTRLETYRIPKELVGRPGRNETIPKRLFPIFRDRDELPLSHDLGSTIQDALRASRYLIVLCSPNAAESKWVNEEVRFFKSLGRADRILAVIVSGIPNGSDNAATANMECFPPALRYHIDAQGQMTDQRTEPIGGDLRSGGDGWTGVLLKAIAGITGMGYDAFAKREAKRARRKRVIYWTLAFVCMCAGIWYWDYSRLKVSFYSQTAERWGVPYGVNPLSTTQRRARGSSFRFESRGYKVRRVEQINGSDALIEEDASGAARTDLFYREDGTLERIMLYDRNGKLVTQKSYSKPGPANEDGLHPTTIAFLSKSEFAQTLRADSTALTAPSAAQSDTKRADITAYQAYFNQEGQLKSIFFRNAYGSQVADPSGVYGQSFKHNNDGLVIETINLDATGLPMRDRRGVQSVQRSYGVFSSLTRQAFLDSDGKPILGPDHVAIFEHPLDAVGNPLEKLCFDENEKPTLHKDGYHRQTWQYDSAGNTIAGYLFDTAGNACLHRDGYAGSTFEFDSKGYLSTGTYLGLDGQPVLNRNGVCQVRSVNDLRGNSIETVLLDTTGQPTLSTAGWSKIVRRFDAQGNLIETSLFDAAGKPTLSKSGVWRIVYIYDDRGNQVEFSNFGIDGALCIDADGIAIERVSYDELGNAVEIQYLGTDSRPTIHKLGMAKKTMTYDKHGNVIETKYLGMAGEPILAADGYARFTQQFDLRGNLVEISYFDKTGLLTLNKQGFARQVKTYDDSGWEIRRDFFDTDSRPIIGQQGAARIEYKRDRYGRELENGLYNRNYMPIANEHGVHRIVAEFDARGNAVSMRFIGTNGAPVSHEKYKAAQIAILYNNRDREVDIQFYDVGGQPTLSGELQVARRLRTDDTRGNVVEEQTFGVDGKPRLNPQGFARCQLVYDDHDNCIVQNYFGIDDQPTEGFNGIAKTLTAFDAMSRQVEQSYFDLQGKPAEDTDGVARITQRYDARSQIIEQCFFGVDGQPTIGKIGAARVEMRYDNAGNIVEHKFFGVDGLPTRSPAGMASYSASYDSRGQMLSLKAFGKNGKPCVAAFGSAAMEKRYDRQGRLIEEIAFGTDGKLMRAQGKYARLIIEYDDLGNPKEQRYFDENDQPVASFVGVARAEYRYDKLGNQLEVTCYGVDGKLAVNKDGYARLKTLRDDQGRALEQATYDASDNLIVAFNGWAIVRNRYDEQGRTSEIAYFGADGKEIASKPNGIARATMQYNERGQVTELLRFGTNGSRLVHSELAYAERLTYHPNGTIALHEALQLIPDQLPNDAGVEYSAHLRIQYDTDGRTVSNELLSYLPASKRGVGLASQVRHYRDAAGRATGTEYMDTTGKLAPGPNGIARDRVTFDQYGRATRAEGFDVDGQRVKKMTFNKVEVYSGLIEIKYDSLGRPIEYLVLADDGRPVVSEKHPFKTTYEYRRSDKPTQYTQHYNLPPGTPRTAQGSPPVKGTVLLRPDGSNREIIVVREVSGSAAKNDLVHSFTRANAAEQVVEMYYEDQHGKRVLGPDGIGRQTYEYDRFGKISSLRVYGLNGLMIHPKLMAAGTDTLRDDRGNEAEVRRIGTDGKPLPDSEGVAITKRKWDDKARLLVEAYYDREGKMVRRAGKVAGIKHTYNDKDGTEQQQLYDEKSRPFVGELGYAKKVIQRDKQGNITSEQFLDVRDQPIHLTDFGGHHRIENQYDANGKRVRRVFVFATPQAPKGVNGVAKLVQELDSAGNEIELRNLDANGQLLMNAQGYAVLRKKYDTGNRIIEEWSENIDGQPCNSSAGYCRTIRKYQGDSTIGIRYLNREGNPVDGPEGFAILQRKESAGRLPQWHVMSADGQPAQCQVIVEKVMPSSQAESVGIKDKDVLVSYNRIPISHLFQIIELTGLGDEQFRPIEILRDGQALQFEVAKGRLGAVLQVVKATSKSEDHSPQQE